MAAPSRSTTDSAGVVVFRQVEGQPRVLLILNKHKWGSFPKGHLEPGESLEQCALRELREETAIVATLIPGHCWTVPSAAGDPRNIHFLLGVYAAGEINAQLSEIQGALWATLEQAEGLVLFPADKDVLHKATQAYLTEIAR